MTAKLEATDTSLLESGLRRRLSGVATYAIGFGALLAIWYVTALLVNHPIFLPDPLKVATALFRLAEDGTLLSNTWASLIRLLIGFSIGAGAGLLLGVILGLFPSIEKAIEPIVELFRAIPPYAMIPFALLTFGIAMGGKVFVLAYASFFAVLVSTVSGLANVSGRLVEASLTLGASRLFTIRKVLIPAAVPQIMVGMRFGFGLAWLALVAAEMVASPNGLGFMIADAREILQTDVVIAGMLVIGILGYLFNRAFVVLEGKMRAHEK